VVHDVLSGSPGPVRDIVLLNAAAALTAFDKPSSDRLLDQLRASMARAAAAIDSGAAKAKLDEWVAATRSFS
jgi:anthranilate phosphoribosyltransferase